MDDMDAPVSQGRSGLIVGILVVVGIGLLGVGIYLVMNKKKGGDANPAAGVDTEAWCKLRQEWKRKASPLDGDIMVKNAEDAYSKAAKELRTKRNVLCAEYAGKVSEMIKAADLYKAVEPIEAAMVKEGKTRSNLAVKLYNKIYSEIPKAGTTDQLDKIKKDLEVTIANEMKTKRAEYAKAVKDGLAKLQPACSGIYFGTALKSSGEPYTTWEELEVERNKAVTKVRNKVDELRPTEEYVNRVRHDLYKCCSKDLVGCYMKTKKKNPKIPGKMGLKIRFKGKGKFGLTFAAWDQQMDEKILDCLAGKAGKWKLPEDDDIKETDITIDFVKDLGQ